MRHIKLIVAALAAPLTVGCAPDLTCNDPQPYQFAVETPKVDAPNGLDELQESREMLIPRASPQEPRDPDSPCLDLPPSLKAAGEN